MTSKTKYFFSKIISLIKVFHKTTLEQPQFTISLQIRK